MFFEEFFNVSFIELLAGLGYLFGHILLSYKKSLGWPVKIVGGIAWIIFLFQNTNYIFAAVTTMVVLTMFYGFYKWKMASFDRRTRIDYFFEITTALVAIFMIGRFLVTQPYALGPVLETMIVITEILGTVLLARKIVWGWYSYILMSSLVGLLVIFVNTDPAPLLGILELTAIYFYIKGIRGMYKVNIP